MKEDKHVKVLQLIKIKGPVIPSQINKAIEVDVLMGSAILSELVDKGQLRLSNVKIGGSPLYYAPGQEARLQEFSKYLNTKDQQTYELLKQKKVLKDKALEPLQRVSLRQIKDFAKPLNVQANGESIIFWKWYLLSNEEAGTIIRTMLPNVAPKKPEAKPEPAVQKHPEKIIEKPVQKTAEKAPEKPEPMQKPEARKETQAKLEADKIEEKKEQEEQIDIPKDKFFRKIKRYFDENRIQIADYKINRKESDIEFTVRIPSSVGSLTYFCKAKNKKKFNDGDLSSVFIEGQRKKMPVLFIMTGELTKKAKDVLESEFRSMSVKKI